MLSSEEVKTDIGRQLRALRNEKCWKQEYLANKADTAISTISEMENGVNNFEIETLVQIASALNAEVRVYLVLQ